MTRTTLLSILMLLIECQSQTLREDPPMLAPRILSHKHDPSSSSRSSNTKRAKKTKKASSHKSSQTVRRSSKSRSAAAREKETPSSDSSTSSDSSSPDDVPSSCQTLPENTAPALKEALRNANGKHLHLCDTTIVFEQELNMDDIPVIDWTCENECVLEGQNTHRFFSFGQNTVGAGSNNNNLVDYQILMKHIAFQNGRGEDGGGGALQLRGFQDSSMARFEDCTFRNNDGTFSHNGGAIDVWGGKRLEVVRCRFDGNIAHTGGAIAAFDIAVVVEDSVFVNNNVCGAGEGSAIYFSAFDGIASPDLVLECVGSNVFEDNIDGICIDPDLNAGYTEYPYDILGGCTKNCDDVADPFCRIFWISL